MGREAKGGWIRLLVHSGVGRFFHGHFKFDSNSELERKVYSTPKIFRAKKTAKNYPVFGTRK